jgi:hypothetical protein
MPHIADMEEDEMRAFISTIEHCHNVYMYTPVYPYHNIISSTPTTSFSPPNVLLFHAATPHQKSSPEISHTHTQIGYVTMHGYSILKMIMMVLMMPVQIAF